MTNPRELLVAACDIKVGDVISGRTVVRSAAAATTERWVLEYGNGRCSVYYRNAKFRVRRA